MKNKIAIIGMGYVGLPLAIAFSKKFKVLGYDVDKNRVNELKKNIDRTNEVNKKSFNNNVNFTTKEKDLIDSNIFIVTVPTPIKINKEPNLKPLKEACLLIARFIKKKSFVIFESTVYPGCTDEYCIPLIEKFSGFKINKDFYCGYSPERINPGDKKHRLENIKKIVSGSNPYSLKFINNLYNKIIKVGTVKVSSIKIAEAAKIIENTQRDLNIAFMNELSLLFKKMNLDSEEVINAASTKWNFIKFKPGLVGGHCINVDPYYLTYKAKKIGYDPKIILAGRNLNDAMAKNVVQNYLKKTQEKNNKRKKIKTLIMGITFKENCPDIRNSQIIKIYNLLKLKSQTIDVYDPVCDKELLYKKHKIKLIKNLNKDYDGVIVAVAHKQFINLIKNKKIFKSKKTIIYDLKHLIPKKFSSMRL